MDWKTLFLSPEGRIHRQDFWIGWAILFVAGLVLAFIPLVNMIAWAAGIYVRVCLYSKRLHDMGKSGWWQVIPYVAGFVAIVLGFVMFGSAIVAAAMSAGDSDNPAAAIAMLSSMGGVFVLWALASLISLGVLIWVGATPGQTGTNAYGPDPLGGSTVEVF